MTQGVRPAEDALLNGRALWWSQEATIGALFDVLRACIERVRIQVAYRRVYCTGVKHTST
jgi:hypothetical protein